MFKKLKLIFLILFLFSFSGYSQSQDNLLAQADSLFQNQRFTQSFDLYDSLYNQQAATPAMLLKMAYIKEGLGDYTLAQFYLNEYYLATRNDQALTKMGEIAKEKDLTGYETNDLNFLISLYFKHFQWLVAGVISLSVLLFIFFLIQLLKFRLIPPLTTFFMGLTLIGLFILINFGKPYNKALITKNNTFIMAGPSAGADVIDVIGKGNKVTINKQTDVWLEIKWDGQHGYIKESNVRPLTIW